MLRSEIVLSLLASVILLVPRARADSDGAKASDASKAPRVDLYGDPVPPEAVARFGTIRFRSGSGLSFAVLSPDGKIVAINGGADSIRLLDSTTGLTVRQIPLETRLAVPRAAFSPDGTLFALSDVGGAIELYRVATGERVQIFEATDKPGRAKTPVFSADGRVIARSTAEFEAQGEFAAWEVATGKLLARCKTVANFNVGVALSPDGKMLASSGKHFEMETSSGGSRFMKPGSPESQNVVQLWDLTSGKELRQIKVKGTPGIGGVLFSADGKLMAAVDHGGAVALVDPSNGHEIRRLGESSGEQGFPGLPVQREPILLSFAPDGKRLAVGGDDVHVWETATGKQFATPNGAPEAVCSLVFADDTFLASGMRSHAVVVWDAATGKLRGPADSPAGSVVSIALAAGARKLFTSDSAGQISSWDASSGRVVGQQFAAAPRRARSPNPQEIDFQVPWALLSPHGRFAVLSDEVPGRISLPADGISLRGDLGRREIARLNLTVPGLLHASFSGDEKLLAVAGKELTESASNGDASRRRRHESGAHRGEVVELIDAEKGTMLRAFEGWKATVQAVAISPDGQLIAALTSSFDRGSDKINAEIRVLEAGSGKQVALISLTPPRFGFRGTLPLAFSPDGALLASIEDPGLVCVYETRTGKRGCVLPGKAPPRAGLLSFSPDGRLLAVGSGSTLPLPFGQERTGGTIQLWELASGSIRKELTGHAGGVTAFAFSDDGRLLASGSADATVLLWDINGQVTHPASKVRLSAGERDALWHRLGSANAPEGYQAILRLSAAPEDAVALFRDMLKPAGPALDAKELKRLAQQLDSQRFAERETAAARLKDAGKAALPGLQEVLRQSPSTELRHRAEKLIDEISAPTLPGGGDVRSARALEVLEKVNTPEARDLLKTLAQGRPDAGLTREAKTVLQRLSAAR